MVNPSRRRMLTSVGASLMMTGCGDVSFRRGVQASETLDPYGDAVLVDGEPPLPEEGAFTFFALPDTQNYSEFNPALFTAQTEWIVSQREARRIAGVFHLGDITNRNTPQEWENARRSMQVLDDAGMPYCMVPGNHDYGVEGKSEGRTTLLNETFPVAMQARRPGWGAVYDKEPDRVDNTFHLMEAIRLHGAPRRGVTEKDKKVPGTEFGEAHARMAVPRGITVAATGGLRGGCGRVTRCGTRLRKSAISRAQKCVDAAVGAGRHCR